MRCEPRLISLRGLRLHSFCTHLSLLCPRHKLLEVKGNLSSGKYHIENQAFLWCCYSLLHPGLYSATHISLRMSFVCLFTYPQKTYLLFMQIDTQWGSPTAWNSLNPAVNSEAFKLYSTQNPSLPPNTGTLASLNRFSIKSQIFKGPLFKIRKNCFSFIYAMSSSIS